MQERMRHFSAHQRNSRTYRSSIGQPLSRQNEDDSSEYGKHTMTTLDRLKIEEALLETDYGQEGWAVAVDGKHAISPHWIRKVLIPNGKKKGYRGNPSVLRKVMFTHSYRPRQHCISMWRRPKTTITLSPWTTAMLLFCKTRCPLVRLTRWSLSTIRFCSREITLLQRIAEGSQTRSTWQLKVNQKFCHMINLLEKNFLKLKQKHHGSKRSCNTLKSIRATRICSSKTCSNTRSVEDNHDVFHPISSEDAKIIREQGILEKHETLQLKDRVVHFLSPTVQRWSHCGRVLKCIGVKVQDLVRIIVTDSYKTLDWLGCDLLWDGGTRSTENKESQHHTRPRHVLVVWIDVDSNDVTTDITIIGDIVKKWKRRFRQKLSSQKARRCYLATMRTVKEALATSATRTSSRLIRYHNSTRTAPMPMTKRCRGEQITHHSSNLHH